MLQRDPNVIVAEVDSARLLLNLTNWTYFSLNETGERIWELLSQPSERADLLRRLIDEYDAPAETIAEDLDSFLARLRELGFVLHAQ